MTNRLEDDMKVLMTNGNEYTDEERMEQERIADKYADDDNFLEWYSRQQGMINSEIDILQTQAAKRIRLLETKRKKLEYFHKDRAQNIVLEKIGNKKKGKFVDTAYGRFQKRTSGPKLVIESPERFIAECGAILTKEELSLAVDTSPRVDANAVKKMISYNGEGQFVHIATGVIIGVTTAKNIGLTGKEEEDSLSFTSGKSNSLD